jgi:spore coat polysaccharide biosynthesis protein SpsF
MILAILQARVSSTRFPAKVLKPLLGVPMIFRQLERIRDCRRLDGLVVATSTDPSDDPLVAECACRGVRVYRGSLDDVLDRFGGAAEAENADAIVRLTADCPLADWQVIDSAVGLFHGGAYDYVSNTEPPTYPDGLDVEVISRRALREAAAEARLPSEREHVTPFIRKHPERYAIGQLVQVDDESDHRWTVDEVADFELVRRIYEALYPVNPRFTTADILSLMRRNPELISINRHIERNISLRKSERADAEWRGKGGV